MVIIPVKMEVIDNFLELIDIILLVIPQNVRLRGGKSAQQMQNYGLEIGLKNLTRSGMEILAIASFTGI